MGAVVQMPIKMTRERAWEILRQRFSDEMILGMIIGRVKVKVKK